MIRGNNRLLVDTCVLTILEESQTLVLCPNTFLESLIRMTKIFEGLLIRTSACWIPLIIIIIIINDDHIL